LAFHVAHVTSDPRVGSTLAGYRLDSVLGRGGMGVVYRAEHLTLRRSVALKLVAPELATDPRFRERFLAESRLAASLEHPNVIPIYDAGEADGQLYLAMRLVEGQSLRDLLDREAPLEPARAIELLAPVASALDAAHARGLVHRDVKPANILLEPDDHGEHVYLSDFGLARLAGEARPDEMSHLSGSLNYLAPEQVTERAVDPRVDVYALGCVLYECLTGEPPYRETSPMTLLWAHASETPPKASERHPGLSKAIDPVLIRALGKEPEDRYPSCGELIAEAAKALGVRLAPRGISRRRLLLLAAGGALGVAAAAAAPAVLLTRGSDNSAKPTTLITRDSLQRIDPATNTLVATIGFGFERQRPYVSGGGVVVAAGAGAVWVANRSDRTILRLDPARNAVSQSISAPGPEPSLAAGLGSVWVVDMNGSNLIEIELRSGFAIREIELDKPLSAVAVGQGAVWAAQHGGGRVFRVDPTSGRVIATIDAPLQLAYIAIGEGSVWIVAEDTPDENQSGSSGHSSIARIDPSTNTLIPVIRAPGLPRGLAAGQGGVWISNDLDDSVWKIDPPTNQVTSKIPVGHDPRRLAVGVGSVWVANSGDGTVSRIDPTTSEVVATIEVGGHPQGIAVGEGGVWVTVYPV
jgi:YVTN family beta-propeller protein